MGALPMAGAANKDSVEYFDHSAARRSAVTLQGGSVVHVTRTTYDNNTSVTSVLENGKTTTFTKAADYQGLVQALKQPSAPTTRAGLSYRYVKTSTMATYIGPENGTVSAITGILMGAFAALWNIPLAVITTIATAAFASASSPVPMWLKSSFTHYGVYDSTGYFLGYYRVDYSARIYLNSSCTGTVVGSESGSYESLNII